jgi:hypothetical protein
MRHTAGACKVIAGKSWTFLALQSRPESGIFLPILKRRGGTILDYQAPSGAVFT